ncbi:HEAT resistant agglutinin 1 protein [Ensifer adhaerens]|uniref:HEAT resistant agglutinin 1 protein n=1 Tax=Ensifer adhaerens TaxID=106592 RepID=A0A0L8BUG8_ENSAD|nr:outer membrane protein [Ensifer adhaerens]KOF18228.1 HEAT resistant agglutinin 1 protein [Ensifer adhaerens]
MKRILSGVVAVLLSGTAAYAADVYQPPIEAPVVEQPVEVVQASGWYLRGDVGYAWNDLRGAHYFQGSNGFIKDFDSADIDDSWVIGGGVGYQINNYLRTDVTLDYWGGGDFEGSTTGSCGVAANCVSTDISSVSAWSLMANVYVDIGTYGAFTPYVGAGIGGTRVKWDGLRNTSCEVGNPGNCDPTVNHGGKDSWRFTYALMAGTAIDLTCNLKADVGYRFRDVDGGDMFGYAQSGGPGYDKGFYIHEARAGLRYSFGNVCEVPYEPPPEPIVYK